MPKKSRGKSAREADDDVAVVTARLDQLTADDEGGKKKGKKKNKKSKFDMLKADIDDGPQAMSGDEQEELEKPSQKYVHNLNQ